MVNEWQPIETSPKKEFELILLAIQYPVYKKIDGNMHKCGVEYETEVGFWFDKKQKFLRSDILERVRDGKIMGQEYQIHNAKFWMPLPSPPEPKYGS